MMPVVLSGHLAILHPLPQKRENNEIAKTDGNGGNSRSLKVEGLGATEGPRWGLGATPPVWVRG